MNLELYLSVQRAWSLETFGPGKRTLTTVDHIRKELKEIEAKPEDTEEWIDAAILALDGACRSCGDIFKVVEMLQMKQHKNMSREWPDWRTAEPGKAIEHVKD